MIRVLIVDDHAIVRKGLKQILADEKDISVAGEASTSAEAVDLLHTKKWDVVVVDLSLPDRSGLDLLHQIKFEHKPIAVLILTMHMEEQYAVRALRLGAAGYLLKDSAPEELVAAIRTASRGGRYLSPPLAAKLAFALAEGIDKQPHDKLSHREFQIFSLLASGRTVGEIASMLSISVKTVSTHRVRVLKKLELKNNAQLILYAVQRGLVATQ